MNGDLKVSNCHEYCLLAMLAVYSSILYNHVQLNDNVELHFYAKCDIVPSKNKR